MQNQTAAASKSFKIKVHFRLTGGKGCSTRDQAGLEAPFFWDSTTSSSLLTMGPDCEVFIHIPRKDKGIGFRYRELNKA